MSVIASSAAQRADPDCHREIQPLGDIKLQSVDIVRTIDKSRRESRTFIISTVESRTIGVLHCREFCPVV
jgi:hypothetical protein